MTPLELNALGFEGDGFLKASVDILVKKHKIDTIIETGTYFGATTLWFSEMANEVYSIEVNPEYYDKALKAFFGKNIALGFGSSVDVLPSFFYAFSKEDFKRKYFFWLDAHWGANNPLLQELAIIADSGVKPVIAIHDFKVPNHPELGYDSYGGQDYEWSWIEQSINNIYGKDGYTYHYNSEATGAMRGVIFIEPK